jgi:hypothetical protein
MKARMTNAKGASWRSVRHECRGGNRSGGRALADGGHGLRLEWQARAGSRPGSGGALDEPADFYDADGRVPQPTRVGRDQPANGKAYVVSTGASPNGPLRFNQMAQGLVSVFDIATRAEVLATQSDTKFRRTAPLNMNQGVNLDTAEKPRLFHTNPAASRGAAIRARMPGSPFRTQISSCG